MLSELALYKITVHSVIVRLMFLVIAKKITTRILHVCVHSTVTDA